MNTKVLILVGLVCLSLVVFLRSREFFSSQDLSNSIPFVNTQTAILASITNLSFLLNELSKNSTYSSANELLSVMDPTMSYTSDTQIEELFRKAYTDGEAGLPEKDRLFLREIAYYSIQYVENLGSGVTITYTSDGVPDFTDATITESTKSAREFLFSVLKSDYNNILPSRFARVPTENYDINTDTDQQRALWIIRATTIPHAYIKWLAENKWKLDMTWKSSLCPASTSRTPSRITTMPGNLSFGPGTYTMAQLGNPTSLNLFAPIKVIVNKSESGSSSTHEVKQSIGCRGVDETVNNLSGATSIVVSLPT